MKCPFCGSDNTRVIDSRPADDNTSIRRRRLCDDCGKRFTTYEKVETIPLIIIKKDNNREQYDRAKIEAGVLRACHKRPISAAQISQLVDEVETDIFNREEKEISSTLIGEIVMDKINILNQTTENIIETTSHMLKEQGSEIQKHSAETMISPDVLKSAFAEALQAINDVSNYKVQALPQMKETINLFSEMANEGQKVVDKIETTNNNVLE